MSGSLGGNQLFKTFFHVKNIGLYILLGEIFSKRSGNIIKKIPFFPDNLGRLRIMTIIAIMKHSVSNMFLYS